MKFFNTFGLPAILLLFSLGCGSEAKQQADNEELLDYDGLVFEPTDPESDIIPDVVNNYLSGFDYPDSLLMDTTVLFISTESLNNEIGRLRNHIREFVAAEEDLPEYAASNLYAVNQAFSEYALFKMLRDIDEPKTPRDLARISMLIRNGSTTIKPEYLAEIMDSFPEKIRTTQMWQEKRVLLEPREMIGLSLYELPESQVFTRAKRESIGFHGVLAETSAPTVLVFTASWCGPCKVDFDRNRASFQKLENNGIRVISYSLDRDLDKWTRLLNEANYIEECYCDLEGFDSSLAGNLGITAIPTYVLVSGTGVVKGIFNPSTVKTMFNGLE